jgi:hypothetical protein
MSSATPRWWQLAAYGLLGLALAAALPCMCKWLPTTCNTVRGWPCWAG